MESDKTRSLMILKDVSIRYGSIKALERINLDIRGGEIHAIVGEHGAGKSTLAKMVANLIVPDSGEIRYRDLRYDQLDYKETIQAGVRMVFQKMQLNQTMTVAENLFIANKQTFQSRGGLFSHKKVERLAEAFLRENHFDLNPRDYVSDLELSDRALLSIVKNLYHPPEILILDEALEKLSAGGLERIILALRELRDRGSTVLFITHRIDDLYMIADRVSVVRKGEILFSDMIGELDKISLIKMAYTQFSNLQDHRTQADEFNKLMKYNEVILTDLPISLLVTNYDNKLRMINESARGLFRIPGGQDLSGMNLEDLFVSNERILKFIHSAMGSGEVSSRYNVPLSLHGQHYMVNIVLYPIYDRSEQIGNMFILEDITEREQLRDQLVLSEKLASLGLLAAGVGHEINNPLGVISNYLEAFKQDKIGAEEKSSVIEYLFEQINYISQVVGNLISFSENRKQETVYLDVNTAIHSIIDLVRFNGAKNNIEIDFQPLDDDRLHTEINPGEFKQVILNLFRNAFDVLRDGGIITIRSTLVEEGGETRICLDFEDNGPGISFDDPSDVFLPFKSSKRTGQNFGLGLSLCYNILNRYGGEITVHSEKGAGCRFQILLKPIG
ncbi:MAG: ATP-binding cassette domain-containing protein [Spirochaetales bacterium]|nr:ATP-binding cassette domain-containing protein [Spirochaetales bacterium]